MRPFASPVIIPLRQYFGVKVTCEQSSLKALLEVMPCDIAPQALIWIHLDGVMTRDVA